MTVQNYTLSFGSVRPIPKGTYIPTLDYKHLNIVTTDAASYICTNRAGAPSGTSLEDGEYWQLIARNGLDGAVTFATTKEYESEAANKAVAPLLLKPLIDGINVRQEAFEKYGKIYDSYRLEGKTIEDIITAALARIRPEKYVFTKDGTITAPLWATKAKISGCGAGGGGGGGVRSYGTRIDGGAGGGAGATVVDEIVAVVPGQTYDITIGKGGTRGYHASSGTDGGATKFGSLLTLNGGEGGEGGAPTSSKHKAGTPHNPLLCTDGEAGGDVSGGYGGSTVFGVGGVWESTSVPTGQVGQGAGAGGSGGYSGNDYCYGSAGADGILYVEWLV